MRLLLNLLRVVALLIVVGAGAWFVLTRFFGMQVEMGGSGMAPIVSFNDPDEHYDQLEAERAAQAAAAPPPVVESSAPPESVAAAVAPAGAEAAVESAPPAAIDAPWPDYRGRRRDGVYDGGPLNWDWDANSPPELWRTKVGGGYASMVVADGRVYTIEQRRANEVVAAYDLDNGRQLWEHGWPALFQESMGGDGPRATPTWSGGVLYALGAKGDLRALDAKNGELLWKTNILTDAGAANIHWGMSGSPLVVDGKVIVNPGGRSGKSVIAYGARDGKIVWTALDDQAGYASPQLATVSGRPQVLVFSGERIVAVDPADGALLWAHPWRTDHDINSAQPIVVDRDHVWISSAYDHGAALLKIAAADSGFAVEKVWERNTMKNKFNSAVLFEGQVYGLDESILASIDVRSGERNWKGGRYGFGQLLLAGDRLIVLTESGEVVQVKATPDGHEEVARFSALEGKTWNVPALADGKLLVRNQTEMAAYDLSR